jgi:hypothetical protein
MSRRRMRASNTPSNRTAPSLMCLLSSATFFSSLVTSAAVLRPVVTEDVEEDSSYNV